MADNALTDDQINKIYGEADPYKDGTGISDFGKAVGGRLAGMGSDLGAMVRALGENTEDPEANTSKAVQYFGELTQGLFGDLEGGIEKSLSPDAARRIQSTVTDPDFWSLTTLALKGSQMVPDVAATVGLAAAIPATIFPAALMATATAAGTGAVMSSAGMIDDVMKATDALPDAELQEEVPAYRELRASGVPEREARQQYNAMMMGYKPLMLGVLGAVTNSIGVGGMAARGLTTKAGSSLLAEGEKGVAKRVGSGIAEGGSTEAIQSGAEVAANQDAMIAGGLQEDYDVGQIATGALEGGVLGGLLGGGISGVAGNPSRPRTAVDEAMTPSDNVIATQPVAPPVTDPAVPGVAGAAPVVDATDVTSEGSFTTAQELQARKNYQRSMSALTYDEQVDVTSKVKARGLTVVDPIAPSPEQSVALENAGTQLPPEVTPAQPVVEAPVSPVEGSPEAATVAPVGDTAPVAEATPAPAVAEETTTQTPDVAPAAPVEAAAVDPNAPVDAVAAAPIDTAPVEPARTATGARILEDRTGPDFAAQQAERVATNLAAAEAPLAVETQRKGKNYTAKEIAARQALNDTSRSLAEKYAPAEVEADAYLGRKPQKVTTARGLVLDRVKAMVADATAAGVKIPKAINNVTKGDMAYTPEAVLLSEANRLARMQKPGKDDFQRFLTRELDIRAGAGDAAIAERRAEGDAAMGRGGDIDVDTIKRDKAATDAADPQNILEREQEDADAGVAEVLPDDIDLTENATREPSPRELVLQRLAERQQKGKPNAGKPRKADRSVPPTSETIPTRVEEALDRAMAAQEGRKEARQVVVERVRSRKVKTPPQTPSNSVASETTVTSESKPKTQTQKMQAIKARVQTARGETNTNPSVAQVQAGNYEKGRVTLHGNTIAIENPKGSVRTNKDPNGPKWSVKLKNDYGQILGTKGADGDPIDVYLGPDHDAQHVFVVDQIDPDTGRFDEHKVMMGFKGEAEAFAAYDAGFSDGSGFSRIGDMQTMTLEEFNAWKNSPRTKKPHGAVDELAASRALEATPDTPREALVRKLDDGPSNTVYDPDTYELAQPLATMDAKSIMASLDISSRSAGPRAIAEMGRKALTKLVGDVKVHIISESDMARLVGRNLEGGERGPRGVFYEDNGVSWVTVRADQIDNPEALAHTVLHEVTHAATARAIADNPALRADVDAVRAELVMALDEHPEVFQFVKNAIIDADEFVADSMSDPNVQEILARLPASPELVTRLGLDRGIKLPLSIWDTLVATVRRALGIPKGAHTLLDAALRVSEQAMKPKVTSKGNLRSMLEEGRVDKIGKEALKALQTRLSGSDMQPVRGKEWLLGFRTFDNIARVADRYFPEGQNPIRKIANLVERRRTLALEGIRKVEPMLMKIHGLEKKYSKVRGEDGRTVWENFAALSHDETSANVFADRPLDQQKHITKKGARDAWRRAQHADLAARYEALPEELQDLHSEALDYFKNAQNEAAHLLIKNGVLKMFDVPASLGTVDALATRIMDRTVTDADKAFLGDTYDTIAAAGVMSKIDGPYFPLMRHGNWVVRGTYAIKKPSNGVALGDNEFEFKTAAEAEAYAESIEQRPTVRTVFVDKTTGENFGVTPEGNQVKLTAADLNAEARYRVAVQNRHVEMFDTERKARQRVLELRKSGMNVADAVPRAFENNGIQGDVLSSQMQRLSTVMERKAVDRGFTGDQTKELLAAVNEMSLHVLSSTRIQTRHLPRQYVQGASKDFFRNTTDYSHSMANYVAKLKTKPLVDDAVAEFDAIIKDNPQDGFAGVRQELNNEIKKRLTSPNVVLENKTSNAIVQRILAVSFVDKLASPSYSVINATQPMMTTMPMLASHYGIGRAFTAMSRAYGDIGSLATIRQGALDTARKAKNGDYVASDPVSLIRSRLKSKVEQMFLDVMVERGIIDTDSGLEVGKLSNRMEGIGGRFDAGLGYLEGITRQMPKAVEAINRSVSGLAAFRLEMERSGDVDRATQFAQDIINQTQFNYSATNAPAVFNHPVLRLALQFKKYGQGMYQLLGEQAARAVRNEKPGDRAQAIKALSYTIGMHVLIAGAMGLPTEPIKFIVMGANAFGLTDWNWGDIENAQREAATEMFGKTAGEMISRGVTRGIGIDLSTRMGIDTLMGGFGEPRSNEAQDLKAYMWDTLAGAPAGLAMDYAKGVTNLAEGDMLKAAERLVPIKLFSDSVKSYRAYTEGVKSDRSGKQVMSPYSAREAVTRTLGFTPAREAEGFERSGNFYRNRDKMNASRTDFQRSWLEASGAARGRLWREIQAWNKTQPDEAKLSISDLRGYQKQMKADRLKTIEGIRPRGREKELFDTVNQTYNY